jgi:uncharacterized protein YceK
VVRQRHLIALVVAFLIGCAILLIVGCAGVRSETSKKEEQGSSPQATESEEEARCQGTRTYHIYQVLHRPGWWNGPLRYGSEEDMKKADKKAGQETMDFGVYTTNDLPGCPNKGGLFLGTEKPDMLDGKHGDDEVRGLGGSDHYLDGGDGNDIIYGGDGDDDLHPQGQYAVGSMEETVAIPSTEATATTVCREVPERMSSMAGMATMFSLVSKMGRGTSSIAAKAGTNTSLARTTMWTAVARRRFRPNGLIPYDIGE